VVQIERWKTYIFEIGFNELISFLCLVPILSIMEINFREEFKDYSDRELLMILKQSDSYQPAAIDAAREILAIRGVSEESFVDSNFEEDVKGKKDETRIYEPKPIAEAPDWLSVFFVIAALIYSYTWIQSFAGIVNSFENKHDDRKLEPVAVALCVLVPVMFVMLLMKKNWGWVICFSISLFSVGAIVIPIIVSGRYLSRYGLEVPFILSGLLHLSICIILNRKKVTVVLGVTEKQREFAFLGAIVLLLVYAKSL
jgi:hypothetical protein